MVKLLAVQQLLKAGVATLACKRDGTESRQSVLTYLPPVVLTENVKIDENFIQIIKIYMNTQQSS